MSVRALVRKALVHMGIGLLAALVTGVAAFVVEGALRQRGRREGTADVVVPRRADAEALRVGLFVVGCG
ncbi:hypothetical protein [Allokutzneria albata]|uniref:Uncharacterized protein n=1 Tax=Allokutzneria albata TaxID=211114 RepID=A0A1G9WBC7_ALLAB|nr:hypothetical protein [Allokutzneria albata]SDM81848.1 hypothetical protein SAMN04489726_3510 [Allokutzneria albata]